MYLVFSLLCCSSLSCKAQKSDKHLGLPIGGQVYLPLGSCCRADTQEMLSTFIQIQVFATEKLRWLGMSGTASEEVDAGVGGEGSPLPRPRHGRNATLLGRGSFHSSAVWVTLLYSLDGRMTSPWPQPPRSLLAPLPAQTGSLSGISVTPP